MRRWYWRAAIGTIGTFAGRDVREPLLPQATGHQPRSQGDGLMKNLLRDARYGFRILLRRPAFTFVAVLTLALGIGANAAIFSVAHTLLVKPLPYVDAERLDAAQREQPVARLDVVHFVAGELSRLAGAEPVVRGDVCLRRPILQLLERRGARASARAHRHRRVPRDARRRAAARPRVSSRGVRDRPRPRGDPRPRLLAARVRRPSGRDRAADHSRRRDTHHRRRDAPGMAFWRPRHRGLRAAILQ